MFNTLYSKLATILLSLLLSVGIFYTLLLQSLLQQSEQSSNQQLNLNLASDLVHEMELVKQGEIDQQSMRDAFHMLMLVNPSIEIYFVDAEGKIVSFSADKEKIKRKAIDLEPIQRFIKGDADFPLLGDDPRSVTQQKSFSVAALPNEINPQGYLYVVLQGTQYDEIQMREQVGTLQTLGLSALVGSLLMGLLIGLFLFYFLTRRIRKLNQQVDQYHIKGISIDAHRDVKKNRRDEISQLSDSFEAMAKRIDEQLIQLQNQDTFRREMVANISHDLRTPLAAIHGYIERLKTHSGRLSDEEREEFLDICFRHSQRLNHMIEELFELSKLEAKETKPMIEAFSLLELVQDVLQKFNLQAEKKKLALRFKGDDQLPLVNGDISMIDRALSNLLDNAISCTDAGGVVQLILNHENDAISVQVKDTGIGIDQKYLPTLFQRFYQVGSHSRDNSQHAGLGLTITHRILELHGQNIKVISQKGQGTSFLFRMPLATAGGVASI
jgi:two-component system, OmpR family, sensor kinase